MCVCVCTYESCFELNMSQLRPAYTQLAALYGSRCSTPNHFSQTPLSMKHMINIFSADLNTGTPQDHTKLTRSITGFDCSKGEGVFSFNNQGSGDSCTVIYLSVMHSLENVY